MEYCNIKDSSDERRAYEKVHVAGLLLAPVGPTNQYGFGNLVTVRTQPPPNKK